MIGNFYLYFMSCLFLNLKEPNCSAGSKTICSTWTEVPPVFFSVIVFSPSADEVVFCIDVCCTFGSAPRLLGLLVAEISLFFVPKLLLSVDPPLEETPTV